MEILTREIIGQLSDAAVGADSERILAVNLARGNAMVYNEIQVSISARGQSQLLTGPNDYEGFYGFALDNSLLAAADLPQLVNSADPDVGQGRGLLELLAVNLTSRFAQDDVNGHANGASFIQRLGMSVDYRMLAVDDRPMSTENPSHIWRETSQQNMTLHITTLVRYQVVRLTDQEISRLSGDFRPTVLRMANTSVPADIRRTFYSS